MFIYMIQHVSNPSLIYIGSTDDFEDRIKHHKHDCYNEKTPAYNGKKYKIIRDYGGFENFKFQIIDAVITADKDIRIQYEQYYIDKFQSIKSMNTFNAIKDVDKTKAKTKAKQAQYHKSNLDIIKAQQAQYYKSNADKLIAKQTKRRSYKKAVKELLAIDV